METYLVRVLVEHYEEDGGEYMNQKTVTVMIDDYKNDESFSELSRRIEPAVNKVLPANECVNYIQDIERIRGEY